MFLSIGWKPKEKERKQCYRVNPLLDDKFVATAPLDRRKEDAVSFQFKDKPGWFLRARERSCFIEPRKYGGRYGRKMFRTDI